MKGRACALAVVMLAAAGAWAQGTITSGDLELTFFSDLANPNSVGNADLKWNNVDELQQLWFWNRCIGDTQETAAPVPDNQVYVDGTAILEWNNLCFGYQQVTLGVEDCAVTGTCSGGGLLVISAFPSSGVEAFFIYLDFDLNQTSCCDSASRLSQSQHIHVQDGASTVDLNGWGNSYQVTQFGPLRNSLMDSGTTDLDDSGLPFGPGDFTVAYQAAGGSGLILNVEIGASVFVDGFESSDVTAWSTSTPP